MECVICKIKGLDIRIRGTSSPFLVPSGYVGVALALADSKHFRATARAYALSSRFAVLHGDTLGVFHFLLGAALHAISLHIQASSRSFAMTLNYLTYTSQVILPHKNWG